MTDIAVEGVAWDDSARAPPASEALRPPRLRAEVLTGPEAYRELAPEWRRLARLQRSAVVFQTPEMLLTWSRHFEKQRPNALATIMVRNAEGHAVLIWPLLVERQGWLRVARGAGTPVGQYDEFLLDPDHDAGEALAAARRALIGAAAPDVIVLERVRADGALCAALGDAAPLGEPEGAPYADLSAGAARLMASLKPRVTRQQKKRVRRFEQEGSVGFEVAADPQEAQQWLAEALELKREWLCATGRFSRAFVKSETADYLADCARSFARPDASPQTIMARLTLDGRTAAIEMGFRHRGAYHLYLGAFAPELAKFGPGNILTESACIGAQRTISPATTCWPRARATSRNGNPARWRFSISRCR